MQAADLFCFAGEEVSLDTKNDLLALLAYRGLGSKWASRTDAAGIRIVESYRDLRGWPAGKDVEGRSKGTPTEDGDEAEPELEALVEGLSAVSYHGVAQCRDQVLYCVNSSGEDPGWCQNMEVSGHCGLD